jgi:hypothetical protein
LHERISNSETDTVLLGADFTPGPRLTFSFRAGAELRYDNIGPQVQELYPYAESTLDFKVRPRSTLEWYNRYGLEESDVSNQGFRKTYRTGLKMTHQLGGKTAITGAVYFSNNEYVGPVNFSENIVDAELSASYALTRKLCVTGGYTFTRDSSGLSSRSYSRDRVNAGLSYSF